MLFRNAFLIAMVVAAVNAVPVYLPTQVAETNVPVDTNTGIMSATSESGGLMNESDIEFASIPLAEVPMASSNIDTSGVTVGVVHPYEAGPTVSQSAPQPSPAASAPDVASISPTDPTAIMTLAAEPAPAPAPDPTLTPTPYADPTPAPAPAADPILAPLADSSPVPAADPTPDLAATPDEESSDSTVDPATLDEEASVSTVDPSPISSSTPPPAPAAALAEESCDVNADPSPSSTSDPAPAPAAAPAPAPPADKSSGSECPCAEGSAPATADACTRGCADCPAHSSADSSTNAPEQAFTADDTNVPETRNEGDNCEECAHSKASATTPADNSVRAPDQPISENSVSTPSEETDCKACHPAHAPSQTTPQSGDTPAPPSGEDLATAPTVAEDTDRPCSKCQHPAHAPSQTTPQLAIVTDCPRDGSSSSAQSDDTPAPPSGGDLATAPTVAEDTDRPCSKCQHQTDSSRSSDGEVPNEQAPAQDPGSSASSNDMGTNSDAPDSTEAVTPTSHPHSSCGRTKCVNDASVQDESEVGASIQVLPGTNSDAPDSTDADTLTSHPHSSCGRTKCVNDASAQVSPEVGASIQVLPEDDAGTSIQVLPGDDAKVQVNHNCPHGVSCNVPSSTATDTEKPCADSVEGAVAPGETQEPLVAEEGPTEVKVEDNAVVSEDPASTEVPVTPCNIQEAN